MITKSKGDSIRQKLTTLSKKMGVKFSDLETVFLIERLVARLISDKSLAKSLVFKGGFVGLKIYESPRYTVDLDALLLRSNIEPTLKHVKEKAESDLNDGVWFRFESQVNLATQGEYGGIRHVYRAGIGAVFKNLKKAQVVHFDLGIGDPVTPAPQNVVTPTMFEKNEEISWSVYPIETICAEKLHALISHGDQNSRSKDVHDLAVFLPRANNKILKEAIEKSFVFRGTEVPASFLSVLKSLDTTRLEKGWVNAVASINGASSFKVMFKIVLDHVTDWEK